MLCLKPETYYQALLVDSVYSRVGRRRVPTIRRTSERSRSRPRLIVYNVARVGVMLLA